MTGKADPSSVDVECIVIGAGVVGLAVARELAGRGVEVLLLDAEDRFGSITSARNSEVVHAGIYYRAGSLKATTCVAGRQRLYAYCEERGIAHRRLGKLIVATDPDQVARLDDIAAHASRNGVSDLQKLDAAEVAALERQIRCEAALHSPSTGIVDSHAFMASLLGDAERDGAVLATHSQVVGARPLAGGTALDILQEGAIHTLSARHVINAAGHGACGIAGLLQARNPATVPMARFARGNYFRLKRKAPVSRLVYPVPEPGGLGVHVTIDLNGCARFGPDVEWIDRLDHRVDAGRADAFYAEIRRYWPGLPDGALEADYAGVRPKIVFGDQVCDDFIVSTDNEHGIRGWVDLFGIESPGLTASLALADLVSDHVRRQPAGDQR